MSAVFTPQGLYAPRRDGGDQVRPFALRGGIASAYAANVGIGDPVKLVTAGTYQLAAAGDAVSAVFAGWLPEDSSVYEQTYWKSGTTYTKAPIFLFWPLQDVLFSIQANGAIAQTAIGDAADHVAGTLNTNSGKSGAYLSTTLAGSGGASAQYKIKGLRLEQGNDWGDTYTIVEVTVNERTLDLTVNTNAI